MLEEIPRGPATSKIILSKYLYIKSYATKRIILFAKNLLLNISKKKAFDNKFCMYVVF